MSTSAVIVLEDSPDRVAPMAAVLRRLLPGCRAIFFEDAGVLLAWLAEHLGEADLISLDHDLPIRRAQDNRLIDYGTGRQVADYLAALPPTCPVIVHSSNAPCAAGMMAVLDEAGWPCRRVYPRDDVEWIGQEWAETVRELIWK